jgi:hypothetical protein
MPYRELFSEKLWIGPSLLPSLDCIVGEVSSESKTLIGKKCESQGLADERDIGPSTASTTFQKIITNAGRPASPENQMQVYCLDRKKSCASSSWISLKKANIATARNVREGIAEDCHDEWADVREVDRIRNIIWECESQNGGLGMLD